MGGSPTYSQVKPPNPADYFGAKLAKSLRYAMGGAQEIAKLGYPQAAEVLFKYAAKPFSDYEGYDPSWDPSNRNH